MLKRYYDKLIALLMLIVLLGSLLWIGLQAGKREDRRRAFDREIAATRPSNENPTELSAAIYADSSGRVERPFTILISTNNALFVPETRVSCMQRGCRKPMPANAAACPFCGWKPPVLVIDEFADADRDGIPDKEEKALGLDPLDANDADRDLDEDGFTNYEEYLAKTNLRDPKNHPLRGQTLRVKGVKQIPFDFVFKSVTGAKGNEDFWFQDTRSPISPRGKLNQPLRNAPEVTVIKYLPKFKVEKVPNIPGATKSKDAVIVKIGNKELTLIQGEIVQEQDPKATLVYPKTGEEFPDLTLLQEFEFDGVTYRVNDIDIDDKTVVLLALTDNSEINLRTERNLQ